MKEFKGLIGSSDAEEKDLEKKEKAAEAEERAANEAGAKAEGEERTRRIAKAKEMYERARTAFRDASDEIELHNMGLEIETDAAKKADLEVVGRGLDDIQATAEQRADEAKEMYDGLMEEDKAFTDADTLSKNNATMENQLKNARITMGTSQSQFKEFEKQIENLQDRLNEKAT